jgi:hypothetical protein
MDMDRFDFLLETVVVRLGGCRMQKQADLLSRKEEEGCGEDCHGQIPW